MFCRTKPPCIDKVFPRYGSWCDSSFHMIGKKQLCTKYTYKDFHQCESSSVTSGNVSRKGSVTISHLYGLSPVCVLMCNFSSSPLPKAVPHMLHLEGFYQYELLVSQHGKEELKTRHQSLQQELGESEGAFLAHPLCQKQQNTHRICVACLICPCSVAPLLTCT